MNDIFTSVLSKDNAMDRICKSIGPDTTAEILEKGKRAEIGEVRTWGGYKYQKTASGWVPFKEGSKQTSNEPKESGDKAEIEAQIKKVEDEQDQIEETTQKNLLAIFKEELGPETVVNFAHPGDRAEIYLNKGLWDSITVKYSHLEYISGDAGERKFGISVGVGSKTIEPGSSYAKIISLANKLLTDTNFSDKVKSELINYQEAGHKLYRERKDLALKLREKTSKAATSSKTSSPKTSIPSGGKVSFEDDLVEVYDSNSKKVYSGTLDYCPYKDDFDTDGKWNEKDKNYDLPFGYKLVGKS